MPLSAWDECSSSARTFCTASWLSRRVASGILEVSHRRQDVSEVIVAPIIIVVGRFGGREPTFRRSFGWQICFGFVELHRWPWSLRRRRRIILVMVETASRPTEATHVAAIAAGAVLKTSLSDGRNCAHVPSRLLVRCLQPLQFSKVSSVVVVLLLHLLANGYEISDALDVVRVRPVDILVELQGSWVCTHPPVARRNHEPPLHLVRLDLRRPREEGDRRLVHLLLDVVNAEPGDDVHVDRPVPVGLQVVVKRLRLVSRFIEEVGEPCQNTWICWPSFRRRDQKREPLVSLGMIPKLLVDVTKLPHHFAIHVGDGVELVKGQERFLVLADVHIDQAEIIDRLQAVSTDSNGFKIHFLRTLELVVHEHAVALVHERSSVVSVCLHCDVRVLLCLRVLRLQEVQEGQVRGSTSHQRGLLPLELLQHLDGLIEFFPPKEEARFRDFQLRADPGEAVVVQRIDNPVES
mmetsp:Transcript_35659/g.73266  ORF Transcript_35659/g.73266 Transcript_35659/m.73266 type:complete len:464 (-) Transcript_35659:1130-2521(-)